MPPRNPSLRRAQGKLFPCTFRCGAGQSGNGGAPNCTRQDEKCLLSESKTASDYKVKFSYVHPGFPDGH
jgi:hypothetical protein